jgi:hypothetical protein
MDWPPRLPQRSRGKPRKHPAMQLTLLRGPVRSR